MTHNLLTIVLVTANRPALLAQALASLHSLTSNKFELIVADDSKSNISEKLVGKLFPKARYFHNSPPLREAANTNMGIFSAKTEYVCLFHDDDLLEMNFVKKVLSALEKDPADILYTGRKMINERSQTIALQLNKKIALPVLQFSAPQVLLHLLQGRNLPQYTVPLMTPGLVFRSNLFARTEGFSQSIETHIDTDFLYRLLAVSQEILFINEPLYISRVYLGISGRTKTSEKGTVFFAQLKVIQNFLRFSQANEIKIPLLSSGEILNHFAKEAISVNGPLTWISLRFNGSFLNKDIALLKTAGAIIKLNPFVLLCPKFYFVLLLNLMLPKGFLSLLHKKILPLFLTKS